MRGKKATGTRGVRAAVLVAALAGLFVVAMPSLAAAKHHKSKIYSATLNPNATIPDRGAAATAPYGILDEPFTVGKKFKHKTVGNVDVTIHATSAVTGALGQLIFRIVAPNGRTIFLSAPGFGATDMSMGPLTYTANSEAQFCFATPPCSNPEQTVVSPWVGTVSDIKLASFYGIPMKGKWLFRVFDATNTKQSVLNSVGLSITPVG